MRSRFFALLLLLTLGLTLGAGAHPCAAMTDGHQLHETTEAPAVEPAPGAPSCHTQAAPAPHEHAAHATEPAPPAESESDGCGSDPSHRCTHVCHTAGLLTVMPPVLTVQAVAQLMVPAVELASSAPSRPIDHVPLA